MPLLLLFWLGLGLGILRDGQKLLENHSCPQNSPIRPRRSASIPSLTPGSATGPGRRAQRRCRPGCCSEIKGQHGELRAYPKTTHKVAADVLRQVGVRAVPGGPHLTLRAWIFVLVEILLEPLFEYLAGPRSDLTRCVIHNLRHVSDTLDTK